MNSPTQPAPSSPNRFDDLTSWLFQPIPTFSLWIDTHPVEDSTKEVKEFMWGKWCRFLGLHSLPLEYVLSHHLSLFFEEAKIAKAQRQRYVRLVERVYAHLISLGLSIKNPGTEAGLEKLGKGANDPTVFLKEEEREEVEQVIRRRFSAPAGEGAGLSEGREEKKRKGRKKKDWVRVRDAAICSVMMGGGATVWAVERLTVSCTKCPEGYISLPRKGGPDYLAPLLPLAQSALNAWINYRAGLVGVGQLLFPSDVTSRQNPETHSVSLSMAPSSIFRAVRSILLEANITGPRACGQTLRNSYAAALINLGVDDQQLTDALGLYELVSAVRLRNAWATFHHRDFITPQPSF